MSRKIKVCFIQGYGYGTFNPTLCKKIGGAEVDFYNVSKELAKDPRFDIYFLTRDFGQKQIEIYHDVKVIKTYSGKKDFYHFFKSLNQLYLKLIQINCDIHVTSTFSKEIGLVTLYCSLFRKIHVHRTAHDIEFDKKTILRKILRADLNSILYYIGHVNSNFFIVQNKEHKEALKNNFNRDSIVIKNSHIIPKKSNFERSYILWVARGEPWKRPEHFLEIAKMFPNYNFLMIMSKGSDPALFETITTEAKKLDNLSFIPGVRFSEITEYFKRAKIFINTSLHEGFPHVFNLAMNYGVPIISLSVNPDNFIDKNEVGLYSNDDINKLRVDLHSLLSNEQLWENMSDNAHRYVLKEMNLEKNITKWKRIFQKLMEIKQSRINKKIIVIPKNT